jgi:hypothetical protein
MERNWNLYKQALLALLMRSERFRQVEKWEVLKNEQKIGKEKK